MSEKLIYLAYLMGWKIVALLPENVAYSLFQRIGFILYSRNGKGVQRLRSNYTIVSSGSSPEEIELLTARGIASYMRYWCDTFRIHRWSRERILSTVSTSNEELLTEPMRLGRGVIVALPHSGNWDHAGAYFCQKGIPLVTVAEVLKPEALFEKFLEHRQRMGFEVLPLDSRAFITLMRRAKEKRLLALVADRDLSDSGIPVQFYGHLTKMPAGPALIAIKTGLPLVAAHVSYTQEGIHIAFTEVPIEDCDDEGEKLSRTVSRLASIFEAGISDSPEDWHMLQRVWLEDGIY